MLRAEQVNSVPELKVHWINMCYSRIKFSYNTAGEMLILYNLFYFRSLLQDDIIKGVLYPKIVLVFVHLI